MNDLPAQLEALLFVYGEPITLKKASQILGVDEQALSAAAGELKASLTTHGRGLTMLEHQGAVQLVTKPDFAELLEQVIKTELNEALSPASLETLSIIAYGGPLSRADIDYIRGVNSTFTIRALLLRGLISRVTDPARGNSYIYSASVELVQRLGVAKIEELPEYEKFRQLAHSVRTPASAEATAGKPASAEAKTP